MSERDPSALRPGLAKARLALLSIERSPRVRAAEGRWKALFDAADAVSEGSVRREEGGDVWYGSTSLILPLLDEETLAEREFLAAVAARDLHVRVRALRVARREAASRAPGPLGRTTCEIRVQSVSGGVRIDVDVQAPLIEGRHLGTARK
jgi:hypothetical protein